MMKIPFYFIDKFEPKNGDLCLRVPAQILNKYDLFTVFEDGLKFPDYFGRNWDAFEECIRDLSWLQEGRIVVNHSDIPLVNDLSNSMIYVAILVGAIRKLSKSENHKLVVLFPNALREQIGWLLRSEQMQEERRR